MKKLVLISLLTLSANGFAQNQGAATIDLPSNGMQEIFNVRMIEGGMILTDSASISLYTFDNDNKDVSVCKGGCLGVWPAATLTAEQAASLQAPFGSITRDDGSIQATVSGLPLYYHNKDAAPGDLNGDYTAWRTVPVSDLSNTCGE